MKQIKGIKVGTTEITSTYTDGVSGSDSTSFEVTAVSLSSISTPVDTVYTGFDIKPIPDVFAIVDGVQRTLELGVDYDLTYSNNINVGNYATVIATGKGNFTGSVFATWSITGATMTVNANDQSYEYDGDLHGTAPTITTVNNQTPTIKYRLSSSGAYTLTDTPQFKNVDNSGYAEFDGTVYFQVTAPNHNTYEGSYQLVVHPKTAVLAWGPTSWRYDGNPHSTTCTVSNLVSGDTCTVTLSGNSITNIGSTTVTATGLDNPNYTLSGADNTSVLLVINPGLFVKISGNWTPVKAVYKRVSGSWVQQDMTTAFSTSGRYIKSN